MLLDVGKFFHKLDVLIIKCIEIFPQVRVQKLPEYISRDFFIFSSMFLVILAISHLTYSIYSAIYLNVTVSIRCIGNGVLVCSGNGGSEAWVSNLRLKFIKGDGSGGVQQESYL